MHSAPAGCFLPGFYYAQASRNRGTCCVGGIMREYRSFYKTVSGNEGSKCRYPTRLDTYGCGCAHNCEYCYDRSLLEFRKLWNPSDPAVADIGNIRRKLDRVEPGTILRLGGMTDCFQPAEKKHRVRYIMEHPLCECCLKEGKAVEAEEVHHILPLSRGGTHDTNNLMSLCRSCHTKIYHELGDQ